MRSGGHFVVTGHFGSQPIDLKPFIRREITIHCPAGWQRSRIEETLRGVHEGRLQTAPLITHRMPARAAAEAWRRLQEHRAETLGIVLDWD
jgi:threonine dehydrogenase-like Zn-dependent dehydrogenase